MNYLVKQFSAKDYLTIRNEYFNDIKGQRTGFRTHLLGWGHCLGTTVLFRRELRFEHAYDAPAYNAGTKKSQLVFASDVIFHF